MRQYKLMNVLLERNERASKAPALYCRCVNPFLYIENEEAYELCGVGLFDFTTYFNACSIKKWQKYTVIKKVSLHVETKGSPCLIRLVRVGALSANAEPIVGCEVSIPGGDVWVAVDLEFPPGSDELLSFTIETKGSVQLRNTYYYTHVEDSDIRPVELALATTTFKKEEYILSNLNIIKKEIYNSTEEIAKHLTVHVVDNGRTLDSEALAHDRIFVHPNDNAGGSGGFARGMIEAMEQHPKATHVLLMDDDVAVSPESIKRTFNLLTLVNDEHIEAFLSGAMLNYDIPEDQWEDVGYVDKKGFFRPFKPPLRMTVLRDIICNEDYECDKQNQYAAWWYCCIPIAVIEREGLPLPLFVRCDDVEYACRCGRKIMTMNGICIWHVSFHLRYNAAVERYQTTRNTLISQAVSGFAHDCDFLYQYRDSVQIELKKFNYQNAELAIEGFEDFLKGPSFIMQQGVAENMFMEKCRNAEKLEPLSKLEKEVGTLSLGLTEVYRDYPRSLFERMVDFATFNGQRMMKLPNDKDQLSVIPNEGWLYPAGKIRGVDKLLSIDTYNCKGVVRFKDKVRFNDVWGRYRRSMKAYRRHKKKLEIEYAAARAKMTSIDFWKKYLGI